MKQAKSGDTVKIYYSGRLDDGTVFSNSDKKEPMQFVIGENSVMDGLKEAVIGMSAGESKTTKIAADKTFGPHLENAVRVVKKKQCPSDIKLGQQLKLTDENVRTTIVKVIDISESKVTLSTEVMSELSKYVCSIAVGQEELFRTKFPYRKWRKICKIAGLSDLKFHDLRKTFCSLLAQHGVSTAVTQRLLEHSSPNLTNKVYTNVDPVLRNAVEKLPIYEWL